jgi:hypothetical protein
MNTKKCQDEFMEKEKELNALRWKRHFLWHFVFIVTVVYSNCSDNTWQKKWTWWDNKSLPLFLISQLYTATSCPLKTKTPQPRSLQPRSNPSQCKQASETSGGNMISTETSVATECNRM